ncbi:MAG: imidazole glycerol phosphate synthase subunit HisH [Desulfobulbia bacterium]
MKIVIIDYGAGNVKSVQFALERLGYSSVCSNDPQEIKMADKVIFPGVGEASSAMNELNRYGLDTLIPELTQPVLGICLGMQLMCRYSEENNTTCLGIFPLDVLRFSDKEKVPHIGWNQIEGLKSKLFEGIDDRTFVYYVHSYYLPQNKFSIAETNYGDIYSGAIKKDNFYAYQFHPEKSGVYGERILDNFIKKI